MLLLILAQGAGMQASGQSDVMRPDAGGPRAQPPGGVKHRVLIADDERRIRQVLARILSSRGITADTAADGAEAVAMTAASSYDLIILDLLMPGRDGFSALREIMYRRPYQPVLVLSCLSDPESKMASLGLGADDFVQKPFHVGELIARVQARLRAAARPGASSITYGGLTLDVLHRQADAGAGPVPLTSREFHCYGNSCIIPEQWCRRTTWSRACGAGHRILSPTWSMRTCADCAPGLALR